MILAAGMGSRYGGLKQVDSIGPHGEAIIEYSIYDAIRAGFGKVVFIIRKSIEADFKEKFESKFKGKIDFDYAYQEFDTALEHLDVLPERSKPWGTAHAMLAGVGVVDAPFAVINADDYYGVDAFKKMNDFLVGECSPSMQGMVGYILSNTLSDNGSVSRGVCTAKEGYLAEINERTNIERKNGTIYYTDKGEDYPLSDDTVVSMNFWGFHPSILDAFKSLFHEFVDKNKDNPKSEFFIPLPVDYLIQNGTIQLKVMTSNDKWYGVTYQEDKPEVQAAFATLTENKVYPDHSLW